MAAPGRALQSVSIRPPGGQFCRRRRQLAVAGHRRRRSAMSSSSSSLGRRRGQLTVLLPQHKPRPFRHLVRPWARSADASIAHS